MRKNHSKIVCIKLVQLPYLHFTNLATGRIIHPEGPGVGDPWASV